MKWINISHLRKYLGNQQARSLMNKLTFNLQTKRMNTAYKRKGRVNVTRMVNVELKSAISYLETVISTPTIRSRKNNNLKEYLSKLRLLESEGSVVEDTSDTFKVDIFTKHTRICISGAVVNKNKHIRQRAFVARWNKTFNLNKGVKDGEND